MTLKEQAQSILNRCTVLEEMGITHSPHCSVLLQVCDEQIEIYLEHARKLRE